MNSITQDMKYRQSLLTYAQKYRRGALPVSALPFPAMRRPFLKSCRVSARHAAQHAVLRARIPTVSCDVQKPPSAHPIRSGLCYTMLMGIGQAPPAPSSEEGDTDGCGTFSGAARTRF